VDVLLDAPFDRTTLGRVRSSGACRLFFTTWGTADVVVDESAVADCVDTGMYAILLT
jgi:hypothetical protein